MTWTLILMIYSSPIGIDKSGEVVALTTVSGFKSDNECQQAGYNLGLSLSIRLSGRSGHEHRCVKVEASNP